MRTITCKNKNGISVEFGSTFSPFLLEDCDGIYTVKNNVALSESDMLDGATYLGSKTKSRNIVLTLRDHPMSDHRENRALLYSLFEPDSVGTMVYTENGVSREAEYYVEDIVVDGRARARQAVVSLICPDPFFYALNDMRVIIAGWEALWTFPHEFTSAGEEFATRMSEKLRTITNTDAAGNIGLVITITAQGNVINPSITHVEKAESIKVGTEVMPLEMVNGDQLVITTEAGNKHIYLTRNGIKTEINEYMSVDSVFIQLANGKNTIGYNAESGSEYMAVELSYRYKYLGV